MGLSVEERAVVEAVADFGDRVVRPVVRELESSNTYPERFIDHMKSLDCFGLSRRAAVFDHPAGLPAGVTTNQRPPNSSTLWQRTWSGDSWA